jgi:hypothetical protein
MTPQASSGAGLGIGILSSVISGYGRYKAGQQEEAAYDYNAAVTLENMRAQMVSNTQAYSSQIGRQARAYAGSGVDIRSGSPLLIMAATAARGAQQNEMVEQSGTEQAALQRYYGKLAAWSGTMSGISSFLSGITRSAAGYYGATSKLPAPSMSPLPEGVTG